MNDLDSIMIQYQRSSNAFEHTRCCKAACLSLRSCYYQIKLPVSPVENILLGLADSRGHGQITKTWNDTKFT